MMNDDVNLEKINIAKSMLESHGFFVIFSTNNKHGLLEMPNRLFKKKNLMFQIGKNLAVPIPDLKIDTMGIFGTLIFNGAGYTCFVPWENVYSLVLDDGTGHNACYWPCSDPESSKVVVDKPSSSTAKTHKEEKLAKVISLNEYRSRKNRLTSV
jgi:hypothetical protein